MSFIFLFLDFFLSGTLRVADVLGLLLLPELLTLVNTQRLRQIIVDVGKASHSRIVVLVLQCLDPLLVVQTQRQLDRELSLSLLSFELLLSELLVAKEPLEGWHDDLKSLSGAVPFRDHLAVSTLVSGCESDFLYRSIVKTRSTNENVGATNLRAKIRLNLVDSDVVVSEVDWLTSKLLTVQSHIN